MEVIKLKVIFEYLKRLIHKGFIRLSLISEISGLILFYTDFDTRDVIVNFMTDYLSYISLFFLFIGTYQVWNDMRLEKLVLEEKLKNHIDYEIKANIKKVKIDLNYIESLIDKNIEKTESLIYSAEQELEKIVVNKNLIVINFSSGIDFNSETFYKNDLKDYIELLKEYKNKKDNYLLEWKSLMKLN